MSGNATEETLRLQFGTASNTIGTQWLALRGQQQDARLMRADGKLRLIAFEAKDRIHKRRVAPTAAKRAPTTSELQHQAAWAGNVQIYDQSQSDSAAAASSTQSTTDGLWSWSHCSDRNLFEVPEFRSYMRLHNFYEGYSTARDGAISTSTADAVEDRLRSELEACDRLRLVQSLVDLDSAWGGFAHDVLTYVADECPRAVVVTFANDWQYPLEAYDDAMDSRDHAKTEARRRLNVGSALSLLTDVSSLFVPLGLSALATTRQLSCGDVSALAAVAIEASLSAYSNSDTSLASDLIDGVVASRNVMALAAHFPYTDSPERLLQRLADASGNAVTQADDAMAADCSFLPAVPLPTASRRYEDEDDGSDDEHDVRDRVFERRLQLRGRFAAAHSAIDVDQMIERVRSASCVVQWTQSSLVVPPTFRLASLAGQSIDAVAQLSASTHVGRYVQHVKRDVESVDKRVLFEFTRAGMNPDALEDLDASLGALQDAYFE